MKKQILTIFFLFLSIIIFAQLKIVEGDVLHIGTKASPKLWVLNSGNVGIGITAPAYTFDLGAAGTINMGRCIVSGTWSASGLRVTQYGAGTIAEFLKSGAIKVIIDNVGNLGIGTTAPATKLHLKDGAIRTGVIQYAQVDSALLTVNKARIGSTTAPDSVLSITGGLHATGGAKIDGDLIYNYRHAVGSADSIVYSVGGTQNVYYKINTGAFTWREADGITGAGDSATIVLPGDYTIFCWLNSTTSQTSDKIRVKLYVNNSPSPTSLGRWIINSGGSGVSQTNSYMWYKVDLAAGDKIHVRVANISGNRSVAITDYKLFIEKKPE